MENNDPNLVRLEINSLSIYRKTTWWDTLFKIPKEETYRLVLKTTDSQSTGSELPILIGKHEAMTMAVAIEGIKPKAPLTVDLLKNATDAFGYKLDSIVIDKAPDGIFLTTMRYSGGENKIKLLARVSDAVTMALKHEAPIFVLREILEGSGVSET